MYRMIHIITLMLDYHRYNADYNCYSTDSKSNDSDCADYNTEDVEYQ